MRNELDEVMVQKQQTSEVKVPWALFIYAGYLTVFFITWTVNGVDYTRIGESTETTKLWYAFPTLFGSLFLVVIISILL